MDRTSPKISVVIAILDEQDVLPEFIRRLSLVLDHYPKAEIIFVNDGSADDSLSILTQASKIDSRIRVLNLSRNFGQQTAFSAGIDYATGDMIITMDADLQDPPELIPVLIERCLQGKKVVYAIRNSRPGESRLKRASASLFYKLFNRLIAVNMPSNAGDFRLIDMDVAHKLRSMPERVRFIRGMVPWLGFPSDAVYYDRPARTKGASKYSALKSFTLATNAVISFSPNILRISTILGLVVTAFSFISTGFILFDHLVLHQTIQGWSSIMVAILFLGGVQLLTAGITGEYVGRIHEQVKARPLYVIESDIRNGISGPARQSV